MGQFTDRGGTRGNRWTPAEIAQLKDLAAQHSASEIAEKLDPTVGGVTFKTHQINLTLLLRTNRTGN
jgi:hypothetical protein